MLSRNVWAVVTRSDEIPGVWRSDIPGLDYWAQGRSPADAVEATREVITLLEERTDRSEAARAAAVEHAWASTPGVDGDEYTGYATPKTRTDARFWFARGFRAGQGKQPTTPDLTDAILGGLPVTVADLMSNPERFRSVAVLFAVVAGKVSPPLLLIAVHQ